MKLYVIYDTVAKESGPVFAAKNDEVAIRNYRKALERVDNVSEFQLMYVADYDNEAPRIDGMLVPTIINTSEDDDE